MPQTEGTLAGAAPAGHRWGDLGVRAASGIVLIAVAVATTWAGGGVFTLAWLTAAVGINWEWQRLIGGEAFVTRVTAGAVALAAVVILPPVGAASALILAAGLLAVLAGRGHRAWAAAGVIYAGLLVMAVLALRFSSPLGIRSIVWLFSVVWSTDVFAYLGGRLIGGPKLWPRVSPSKTWSGTFTGIAAGTLAGTIVATHDITTASSLGAIIAVTLGAAALSQAGDAFESSVKRRFGVKDSSRLIPGHGGLMDRLDGFTAAALFASAIGLANHSTSVAAGLLTWA